MDNTILTNAITYMQDVMTRLRQIVKPVSMPVTIGDRIVPSSYDENIDVDYLKYKYFFQSVSFDKEICEMVLNPKSVDIKREILDMNLGDLMIAAKTKEFMILREFNVTDKQENIKD